MWACTVESMGSYSLCRLCLQNNQSLVDIFEENVEHGFIIKDTIEDLMQFEVLQVKGVPWMACSRCLVKLNDFRLFKIQCMDSKVAFESKFARCGFIGIHHMSNAMEMKGNIHDSHLQQGLYPEIEISAVKAEPSEAEIAQEFYPQVILKTMDENDCLENSSMGLINNDSNGLIKVGNPVEGRGEVAMAKRLRKLKRNKLATNCIVPQIDISRVKAEFQRQLQREIAPNEHYLEDASRQREDVAEDAAEVGVETDWNGRSFCAEDKEGDPTWCARQRKRCDLCKKTFQTKSELKRHSRCHTGERPYLCDICGISFARRYHLVQHNMIHTGEKPYRCEECGKCFSKSSHLNRHRRTHTGERPYSCLICSKSFSLNYNLNAHMKVHCVDGQEQDLPCPHCEKRFTYKHNLLQHLKRHDAQRNDDDCRKMRNKGHQNATHCLPSENPCCCVECLECFPNESDLALHMQSAHVRPYVCDVCNDSFAQNSELTKHRHTHGANRFRCERCDKSFNRRSRLERHLVSVHGNSSSNEIRTNNADKIIITQDARHNALVS